MALLALSVWSGQGIAAVDPAGITARGLEINSPLKLDAKGLMSMKAGQKVEINFPFLGKKAVVFETTTKGLDGLNYWHGSLDGSPRDRVFLKQVKEGFVALGQVRLARVLQQALQDRIEAELPLPVNDQIAQVLGADLKELKEFHVLGDRIEAPKPQKPEEVKPDVDGAKSLPKKDAELPA